MEDLTDLDDFFSKSTPVVMRRPDPASAEQKQPQRQPFKAERREEDYGKEKHLAQQKLGRILFICLIGFSILGVLFSGGSSPESVKSHQSARDSTGPGEGVVRRTPESNSPPAPAEHEAEVESKSNFGAEEAKIQANDNRSQVGTSPTLPEVNITRDLSRSCEDCSRIVSGLSFKFRPWLYPRMVFVKPHQLNGVGMWILSQESVFSQALQKTGFWQLLATAVVEETALLTQLALKGRTPVLLDVNADLGWFSLVWASLGGRVLSVDAHERNVYALGKTISDTAQQDKQLDIIPKFASCILDNDMDNANDDRIWEPPDGSASSESYPTCRIPGSLTNIDAALADHATHGDAVLDDGSIEGRNVGYNQWKEATFTMLKLGIDGWKPNVISGAKQLLDDARRKPCVILLVGQNDEPQQSASPQTVCEELMGFGYSLFRFVRFEGGQHAKSQNMSQTPPVAQHISPPGCGPGIMAQVMVALWPGSAQRPECAALASWRGGLQSPNLLAKVSTESSGRSSTSKALEPSKVMKPCCTPSSSSS